MPGEEERDLRWVLAIGVGAIMVGGTVDLVLDRPATWVSFHVLFELAMIAGAVLLAVALGLGWLRARGRVKYLQRSLVEQAAERDAWRARARHALEGLGQAIAEQFRDWSLTPAESEVALLLLKGHSHKHIARLTGRSEATVRQHAAAVYQKSGLAGRAELAAFFLDGI